MRVPAQRCLGVLLLYLLQALFLLLRLLSFFLFGEDFAVVLLLEGLQLVEAVLTQASGLAVGVRQLVLGAQRILSLWLWRPDA